MGNWLSCDRRQHQDIERYTIAIIGLAKNIVSADGYNHTVTALFEDGKFSHGRIEVWYIFSRSVRKQLCVREQERFEQYFQYWLAHIKKNMSTYHERLQQIKNIWELTKVTINGIVSEV